MFRSIWPKVASAVLTGDSKISVSTCHLCASHEINRWPVQDVPHLSLRVSGANGWLMGGFGLLVEHMWLCYFYVLLYFFFPFFKWPSIHPLPCSHLHTVVHSFLHPFMHLISFIQWLHPFPLPYIFFLTIESILSFLISSLLVFFSGFLSSFVTFFHSILPFLSSLLTLEETLLHVSLPTLSSISMEDVCPPAP